MTLDFSSGHDPRVMGLSPESGILTVWDSLYLPPSLSLSLSKKKKGKKRKNIVLDFEASHVEIISDLWGGVAKIVYLYPLYPDSSNVSILHNHGPITKSRKSMLI